jgi:hypothetical protein
MIIDDPQIAASQVLIRCQGKEAFIQNLDTDFTVKVNGRTIGAEPEPIRAKEVLAMGKTQINFTRLDAELQSFPESPKYLNPQRFEAGSREKAIEHALEFLIMKSHFPQGTAPANAGTSPPSVVANPPKVPPPLPPKPKV